MLGEILRLQYSIGRFRTNASSKKVNKKTNNLQFIYLTIYACNVM